MALARWQIKSHNIPLFNILRNLAEFATEGALVLYLELKGRIRRLRKFIKCARNVFSEASK